MKVLLRNSQNGLYFQDAAKWADSPTEAFDFQGTGQAIRAADEHHLKEVEVVLSFGYPPNDVVLPFLNR